WKIVLRTPYSPDWSPPKKQMYLYAQIAALGPHPKAHSSALALLGKALWLKGYQQQMRGYYAFKMEQEKQIPIPFPYQDLKPTDILNTLVKDFPDDPIRDQAQFTRVVMIEQEGRLTAAREEFLRLIRERPKSKWVSDAQAHLQAIQHTEVTMDTSGLHL